MVLKLIAGFRNTLLPSICTGSPQQIKATQSSVTEHLQLQLSRYKSIHDHQGLAEEFRVGDRVWLHNPAISKGNTKQFTIMWKGLYMVIDKPGTVNYKN